MTETTERFLKEIGEQVGAGRVTEVRLFPSIRQGLAETGVAVVTTLPDANDPDAASIRHTVYSARYRLLVKGPERGQWEIAVTSQAEAPLATIDDVIRGVMHRSGEQLEPERIAGSAFRKLVGWVEPPAPEVAETNEPQQEDQSAAPSTEAIDNQTSGDSPDAVEPSMSEEAAPAPAENQPTSL